MTTHAVPIQLCSVSHCEMQLYYPFLLCYTNKRMKHKTLKTLFWFVCSRSLFQTIKVVYTELASFLMIRKVEWGLPSQEYFSDMLNKCDFLIVQGRFGVFLYKCSNNICDGGRSNSLNKKIKISIYLYKVNSGKQTNITKTIFFLVSLDESPHLLK